MLELFRERLFRVMRYGLTGFLIFLSVSGSGYAAEVSSYVGVYHGSANLVDTEGTETPRDMSVAIAETKDGFNVSWSTTTYRQDGRVKEQEYSVDFLPTDRPDVYSAAMRRNVFGHEVQLDPMKGEPFVWGRITGDTMTIYSLFIDDAGGYELQQFDRTLAKGGLHLSFTRFRNGTKSRSVETFLTKE